MTVYINLHKYLQDSGICIKDMLRVGTPLSMTVTNMMLTKSFLVLNVWSGEEDLTTDAVRLVVACIVSTDRIKGTVVLEVTVLEFCRIGNVGDIDTGIGADEYSVVVVGDEETVDACDY